MDKVRPYAKAIVAALVAGLSALSAQLVSGESLGDLEAKDWLAVAVAFLVALGAVFAVPNESP